MRREQMFASLLEAAAASSGHDRLSHRLVCIATTTSRLAIVLHRAAEQGPGLLPKEVVGQWLGAVRGVRKDSRQWRNSAHVQHLLGLQLSLLEASLMSLPDTKATGKAVMSGFKLTVGVAKVRWGDLSV